MLSLLSADGRPVGKRHFVDGLVPVNIDQSSTIRCATTGRTLWIAPGSPADRANLGPSNGAIQYTYQRFTGWQLTTANIKSRH